MLRRRRGSRVALSGIAPVLGGIAAILISGAFDEPPALRLLAGDSPVNAGAETLSDIRSNNSPTLVRNPLRPTNLAISNRIDICHS